MKHSLMLIESPNKKDTISRYLTHLKDKDANDVKILATIGHIRELDEKSYSGMGFEFKTYDTKWKNNSLRNFKGKTFDVIKEINKEADKSDEIYLSTDPDREGEAIAWHIYSVLNKKNQKKCKRVVFNEITKDAITKALKNPRDLDQNQINSYLARKILDRGLGFKLSKFAQKSIGGASAGRVQSIALKFLKDKHEEILAFVPDHWFNIYVQLENGLVLTLKQINPSFNFELKDSKSGLINFVHESDAEKFKNSLNDYYTLIRIDDPKLEKQKPPKPFKTSSLQSTAINRLNISLETVDRTAQKLYEGVEIDGESISLITYPRTDREDLSETFTEAASSWILEQFGEDYLRSKKPVKKKKKSKDILVQGAHEAIRPTYVSITPDSLEGKIGKNELRLYRLIWLHAVASLMKEALNENILYSFDNEKNLFVTNNRIEKFDGFKSLIRKYRKEEEDKDEEFPILSVGEKYKSEISEVKRVDKRPPVPYTESTLVKALEEKGIGRPSTYTHMVQIVLKRDYATKEEGKLIITDLGIKMSTELEKFFPNIMKYDYTKNMEQELDDISENKSDWKKFLDNVFDAFAIELDNANDQMQKIGIGSCPECGGILKSKFSKKSSKSFIGCANYPNCKYIQNSEVNKAEETGEVCPECGAALLKKKNKWNKEFICCSGFPKCRYIKRDNPLFEPENIGRTCPKCNSPLMKKMNKWNMPFISCSGYPKCKYIESVEVKEEINENCPECSSVLWKTVSRYGRAYIKCSSEKCKFSRKINSKDENKDSKQGK